MATRRTSGLVAVLALIAVACGGPAATPTAAPTAARTAAPTATAAPTEAPIPTIGAGEGALNLVIWTGYAESGQNDAAYDWVTPFQTATGCQVSTTDMSDSNNGVSLMQSGNYDGISASGDATTRLIQGDYVAPIDTRMLSNYANVFPGLKNLPHNTVNGVHYGVPYQWGANVLAYNTNVFKEAPKSWKVVFEEEDLPDGKSNKEPDWVPGPKEKL